jgi:hypothetical protein
MVQDCPLREGGNHKCLGWHCPHDRRKCLYIHHSLLPPCWLLHCTPRDHCFARSIQLPGRPVVSLMPPNPGYWERDKHWTNCQSFHSRRIRCHWPRNHIWCICCDNLYHTWPCCIHLLGAARKDGRLRLMDSWTSPIGFPVYIWIAEQLSYLWQYLYIKRIFIVHWQ